MILLYGSRMSVPEYQLVQHTVALSLLATNPLSTFTKIFSRLLNFLTFFESFKASGTFMSRAHLSYRCVHAFGVFRK